MNRKRSAFTLTELLIVISIIGVLTSSMALAVRGAQERARTYRTETQLSKVENLIQAELLKVINERSVISLPPVGNDAAFLGPHPTTVVGTTTSGNTNFASQGEGLFMRTRRFREEALRVNLLSRFPYQANHLTFDSGGARTLLGLPVDAAGIPVVPYYTSQAAAAGATSPNAYRSFGRVPSWLARFRVIMSIAPTGIPVANSTAKIPLANDSDGIDDELDARTNSSELLYQVLRRIWVDGEPATALFRDTEFGDTDGDGLLEVLDSWGDPVGYRLQIRANDDNVPSLIYNFGLSEYSLWMTNFADVLGGGHSLADFSPDSLSVGRTKVVAYSANIEDSQRQTAYFVW